MYLPQSCLLRIWLARRLTYETMKMLLACATVPNLSQGVLNERAPTIFYIDDIRFDEWFVDKKKYSDKD